MTFSLAARCARTGRFAVAVASSSPAVAARCAFARAEVGAVTTQNITDPRLGPRALDLMALGADAEQACGVLRQTAPHAEYRQFTLVDRHGSTACFSGKRVLGVHAEAQGRNVVSAGNLLANNDVPRAIVAAFELRETKPIWVSACWQPWQPVWLPAGKRGQSDPVALSWLTRSRGRSPIFAWTGMTRR